MKILTRRAAASTGLGLAAAAMLPAPRLARAADKVTWTFSLYGPPRAATLTFEHLAKVASAEGARAERPALALIALRGRERSAFPWRTRFAYPARSTPRVSR